MKPQFSSRLRQCPPRIRNEIRRYRLQLTLTQREVSRQLGVRVSTLSHWEGGLTRPTLERAAKLARILQTSVQALYPEVFFSLGEPGVTAQSV